MNPITTVIQRWGVTFSRRIRADRISPNTGSVKCSATASASGIAAIAKNHADTPVKVHSPRDI